MTAVNAPNYSRLLTHLNKTPRTKLITKLTGKALILILPSFLAMAPLFIILKNPLIKCDNTAKPHHWSPVSANTDRISTEKHQIPHNYASSDLRRASAATCNASHTRKYAEFPLDFPPILLQIHKRAP